MYCIQTDTKKPFLTQIDPQFSPEQVWLRVAFAGLCRTDVLAAKGVIPVSKNRILGHECAGVIEYSPEGCPLSEGARVTVNPLHLERFLGVHVDGAFAEFVALPPETVIPIPNHLSLLKAAFVEPVAAALATVNTDIHPTQKGLVLGTGRIAALTHEILWLKGFHNVSCQPHIRPDSQYDFIVETNIHNCAVDDLLHSLKNGGLLVLKSRMHTKLAIPSHLVVQKSLRIQGAHYGLFSEAIALLAQNKIDCSRYFGPAYSLPMFLDHFFDDEDKKIFCVVDEGIS